MGAGPRLHVPINHFDLFGLRPPARLPLRAAALKTPGPYRLVRHPLHAGWFFAFWSTPTMTTTHRSRVPMLIPGTRRRCDDQGVRPVAATLSRS